MVLIKFVELSVVIFELFGIDNVLLLLILELSEVKLFDIVPLDKLAV